MILSLAAFCFLLLLTFVFIDARMKESDIYVGDKDEHGEPHGKGFLNTKEGITYSGEWANGLRQGRGKATWPNGDEYNGEWADDKMVGKGSLWRSNGHRYDGDFIGGRFNGNGLLWARNNENNMELVYNGTFKDSVYSGQGIMYYNGFRTEGWFHKGLADGPCKVTLLSDDENGNDLNNGLLVYDGFFIEGRYHGKGTKYHMSDNEVHYKIYEGEWEKGKREGEGISYDESGNVVYKGEWDNNVPADQADEEEIREL